MVTQSAKQRVLSRLYALCQERGVSVFDNDDVGQVCQQVGFRNRYDATKFDSSALLPAGLRAADVFVVHLGNGRHQFVKGIAEGYHQFEPIPQGRQLHWPYRRSILNTINDSESNILSVASNQRIVHDFIYEDTVSNPKVYGSNRTNVNLRYTIGETLIEATNLQMEIDLTLELSGAITVFEAKNGEPADFNVAQIFNPFCYYQRIAQDEGWSGVTVTSCYLLRSGPRLRLYLYTFDDLTRPSSIRLLRNAQYTLVER